MKTVALGELLDENELKQLVELAGRYERFETKFVDELVTFLEPKMERINKSIGQENDVRYLAYCIAYVLHRGQ